MVGNGALGFYYYSEQLLFMSPIIIIVKFVSYLPTLVLSLLQMSRIASQILSKIIAHIFFINY